MSESEREYHRNYYQRVRRVSRLARIATKTALCWICDLAPGTAYWGLRDIHCCDPCLAKLVEAHTAQADIAQGVQRYIDDQGDSWEGQKVVHIIEKGQGGVWGELGEMADIPGIQALCGMLSPPGPMRFDMLQPKELKKWPLCPACIQAYADPAGLAKTENHHFGYAIPVRSRRKRAPDTAAVT